MTDTQAATDELGVRITMLVVGAALGVAAAVLVLTKSRQDFGAHAVRAVGNWKEQAAEALAQGRERVVSAVERG